MTQLLKHEFGIYLKMLAPSQFKGKFFSRKSEEKSSAGFAGVLRSAALRAFGGLRSGGLRKLVKAISDEALHR